jgi:hypothetical protein
MNPPSDLKVLAVFASLVSHLDVPDVPLIGMFYILLDVIGMLYWKQH